MALQLDNLNALHPCRVYKNHGAKIQTYQKKGGKNYEEQKINADDNSWGKYFCFGRLWHIE